MRISADTASEASRRLALTDRENEMRPVFLTAFRHADVRSGGETQQTSINLQSRRSITFAH